jgi:hypothetical protein
MTSGEEHAVARAATTHRGQVMSVVLGALMVMLGTGGFAVTRDAGTLPPAIIGLVLLVVGWMGRRGLTRVLLAVGTGIATLGMIGTAAYVPAVARLMAGQPLPHAGRIVVLAGTGLLCFVYVTMGVRSFVRAERSAS